jgi:hypothetical protein
MLILLFTCLTLLYGEIQSHKKKEILTQTTTCMNLDDMMLNEKPVTQRQILCFHLREE